jgi:hypothetical protein
MTTKQGYKVVQQTPAGALLSAYVYDSPAQVDYQPSKYATPKKGCGPLCVFPTLSDARAFLKDWGTQIYECDYEPSPRAKRVYMQCDKEGRQLFELPPNTILARRVKLTKLVQGSRVYPRS